MTRCIAICMVWVGTSCEWVARGAAAQGNVGKDIICETHMALSTIILCVEHTRQGKKDEGRRLREFVEAAYKVDPRVARKKQEERDERCGGGLVGSGGQLVGGDVP